MQKISAIEATLMSDQAACLGLIPCEREMEATLSSCYDLIRLACDNGEKRVLVVPFVGCPVMALVRATQQLEQEGYDIKYTAQEFIISWP
jgi:hypothetical protein